jgi:replicative DNA helicase
LPDLLESAEKQIFEVTQTFVRNKLVHINQILNNRYEEFAEIHEDPSIIKNHRLQVGFSDLDDKLTGLKG